MDGALLVVEALVAVVATWGMLAASKAGKINAQIVYATVLIVTIIGIQGGRR